MVYNSIVIDSNFTIFFAYFQRNIVKTVKISVYDLSSSNPLICVCFN